jgi:hypothetical protein
MFTRSVLAVGGLMLLAGPLAAADPTFPRGSHIGLVPPPGLVPSTAFEGFEDREKKVAFVFVELAGAAYSEIEKGFSPDALRAQGTEVDGRNELDLKDGHGFIVAAHQQVAGTTIRKWILVAAQSDLTALVSAQVPEDAKDTYPEETVRAALASIAVRATVPLHEQLELLPFALKELAGFHIVHASPNGAALVSGEPNASAELKDQSVLLITLVPKDPNAVVDQPGDRDSVARRAIAATPGVKDMHIERSEPLRIGGQPGQEMLVEAKDAKSETALTLVQWIRFGPNGYMRMLGVARKDEWDKVFPRFRAVRDGIEPK